MTTLILSSIILVLVIYIVYTKIVYIRKQAQKNFVEGYDIASKLYQKQIFALEKTIENLRNCLIGECLILRQNTALQNKNRDLTQKIAEMKSETDLLTVTNETLQQQIQDLQGQVVLLNKLRKANGNKIKSLEAAAKENAAILAETEENPIGENSLVLFSISEVLKKLKPKILPFPSLISEEVSSRVEETEVLGIPVITSDVTETSVIDLPQDLGKNKKNKENSDEKPKN